ncbi:signal peptidase I [Streptomyces sp. WAC05374]|uniref:signal peptidase I n=1 Tax=Streptomyces sp. WAC05374 TaxID=2487420 RepID=UPI000F869F52|nr:signal peptidase I [Streptomyces sp. WAC05374]RST09310.1 signal peptidase I [Streptomyces sp. WAC05374]TDF38956.1 signal peptidase I [Streptomyces sp. WAC05374]TDF46843.1 signal peptidase I [Streptomyces sp. WAC05374]TDF48866.1 signal peptidase I [Streptomyces sp. WAC05374]
MAVGARSGHEEPEERPDRFGAPSSSGSVGEPPSEAGPADGDADDDGGPQDPRKPRSFWKELPLLIGIALLLALLIKTFLVQAFSIPSDSMMNTLQRGDRVLVDKLTPWFGSEPERGEVVVFHDPGGWLEGEPTPEPNVVQKFLSFIGLMPSSEEKDLIKRVIAVGGDTVSCKKGGKVVVNGKPLDETSYIHPGSTPCDDEPFGPIKVPEGRIWVMGDNRQNSLDSRYHQELPGSGTVANDKVVGRAVVVAWPLTRWSTLPVPDTFDQPGLSAAGLAQSAARMAGPGALGLAGAVPLVLWHRKRRES